MMMPVILRLHRFVSEPQGLQRSMWQWLDNGHRRLLRRTLRSESEHRCVMPAATSSPCGEPAGSGNFSRRPVSLQST